MKSINLFSASSLRLAIFVMIFGVTSTACTSASASVDEVAVGQGHWLYNVRQTLFAFKNGKRILAQHSPVSGRCVKAPSGGSKSDILVGGFTPLGKGVYRFNVFANAKSVEGDYQLRFTDGRLQSASKKGWRLSPQLTVKVRKIAVTGISFIEGVGGLPIRLPNDSDNQGSDEVIKAYEWESGSRDYPGAFVRYKGTPKKIKVRLVGPPNSTYRISADGDFDGIKEEIVRFDAQGSAVSGSNGVPFFKIQVFPSIVTKKDVTWRWKATKGRTTSNLNTTSHRIYAVWNNPTTSAKYLALYEFGCGWANGQVKQAQVMQKIWLGLSSGRIRLERDGSGSPYWRYWGSNAKGIASSNYWRLFFRKDGQCGAWGTFGAELLNLQGIQAYEFPIEAIPFPVPVSGSSGNFVTFGLRVKSTADHQGDPEPGWTSPVFFEDHALTQKNFTLYDPSFHNGPWTGSTVLGSLNKFENDSIQDFGIAGINMYGQKVQQPNGAIANYGFVPNTPTRQLKEK